MDPTTNRFALLTTDQDQGENTSKVVQKKRPLTKVFIGHLRDWAGDWEHVQTEAAMHGRVLRAVRRLNSDFGFITMETREDAQALISTIGSDRFDIKFDADFETARVVRVPRVYAEWAKQ
jgi:hypothetical protein